MVLTAVLSLKFFLFFFLFLFLSLSAFFLSSFWISTLRLELLPVISKETDFSQFFQRQQDPRFSENPTLPHQIVVLGSNVTIYTCGRSDRGSWLLPWAPPPGTPKSIEKRVAERCLQLEATGTRRESQSAPKSVRNGPNDAPETDLRKEDPKGAEQGAPGPSKIEVSYRRGHQNH